MDLKSFCSTDKNRPELLQPWSRDQWTYATEGHILIRVARREEVPENTKAPSVTDLFRQVDAREPYRWFPIPQYTLTIPKCKRCDGAGYVRDCPRCKGLGYLGKDERLCRACDGGEKIFPCAQTDEGARVCEDCNGSGQGQPAGYGIIEIDDLKVGLAARFLELIKDLPGIQIGIGTGAKWNTPVRLKFDGGDGLLMPMRIR